MNNVRSEAGLARQGKLKRHGSEGQVNAMAVKSLPSLYDKPYPSIGLCVPQAILEDSTFTIAIINVMFYYSTTLESVYASSVRQAVCKFVEFLLYTQKMQQKLSQKA